MPHFRVPRTPDACQDCISLARPRLTVCGGQETYSRDIQREPQAAETRLLCSPGQQLHSKKRHARLIKQRRRRRRRGTRREGGAEGGGEGDNANDGRFEMQIASTGLQRQRPLDCYTPLPPPSPSLSKTNCSRRLCKVAIFALCVEVTATSKGLQGDGGGGCHCLPHCVMACFACFACTYAVGRGAGGGSVATAACINAKTRGADNFLIPVGQQIVASTARGGGEAGLLLS